MNQLILKGLGKRKVKKILNQWIKDQVNNYLNYGDRNITFDYVIYFDQYEESLKNTDIEPIEYEEAFKFIGNKI